MLLGISTLPGQMITASSNSIKLKLYSVLTQLTGSRIPIIHILYRVRREMEQHIRQ
jgi:hypothetical protein